MRYLWLLLAPAAAARNIAASLTGVIKDATGAVVAAARVEIVNSATTIATNLTTPGSYSVTVTMNGFKTAQRNNVALDVTP